MNYLPLFFDIKQKNCLIVGGGAIAARKARLLDKAGAIISVVAPTIVEELQQLSAQSGGKCSFRQYTSGDLNDRILVIAATDEAAINQQVSQDARQSNLPVNVVDNPELCTFIMPAIIDRDPLIIGISSSGQAPVLARLLRAKVESVIPATYGSLARLAATFREKAKQVFPDGEARRKFWEDNLQGVPAELALSGQTKAAEKLIESQLSDPLKQAAVGEVYLVGAGPGDPDLLTFRALRLMQQADVVLYDRLVSDGIMELVRRDADRIYVGKRQKLHAVPQQEINQQLVDLALQGKRVLRLKGGDPFIFGRGGEEIELLAHHNIPFQIVPGITAASGCSTYAGIPLTHRDFAQSVRFITGHLKDDTINLHWPELAVSNQTLVFYMGLTGLKQICEALIQHGRSPSTPGALIEKGTTADQRVIVSDLAHLADEVAEHDVRAPTLLIIGEVVSLQEKLSWFNTDK